jgi:uncharacterized protein YegP (UPF0339 family)
MRYRFRIFVGVNGQYYVTLRHVNGQSLMTSEGYVRRESAMEMVKNLVDGMRDMSFLKEGLATEEILSTYVELDDSVAK